MFKWSDQIIIQPEILKQIHQFTYTNRRLQHITLCGPNQPLQLLPLKISLLLAANIKKKTR